MTLQSIVSRAWEQTTNNIATKKYLKPSNYVSDIVAGTVSRVPLYAMVDNAIVGASDAQVLSSAYNSLKISACGWSLAYTLGNSLLAESLGPLYNKHKKSVDAAYSAATTFGFGFVVNRAAGYTTKQALAASALRAALAVPLGPITRSYTNALRVVRHEPSITPTHSSFDEKSLTYSVPRIAAMITIPLALMYGTLATTANNQQQHPSEQLSRPAR